MAIDEIIKSFDYIKHVGNGESTYEHCREEIALNEAVAIMRKYQKIKEIYDNWNIDFGVGDQRTLFSIGEVLNGNDESGSN